MSRMNILNRGHSMVPAKVGKPLLETLTAAHARYCSGKPKEHGSYIRTLTSGDDLISLPVCIHTYISLQLLFDPISVLSLTLRCLMLTVAAERMKLLKFGAFAVYISSSSCTP